MKGKIVIESKIQQEEPEGKKLGIKMDWLKGLGMAAKAVIKQDAGGSSRVFCRKVDEIVEKKDKDSRERKAGSFVSVLKS